MPPAGPALDRFSEPFPPYGALAAEGAGNLLGRPRLDPLTVLVREAIQNSWDARAEPSGPVSFSVRAHHLDATQRATLRDGIFAARRFGDGPHVGRRLAGALDGHDVLLLCLTDRGTKGLGGPVRADVPAGPDEATDFVDLLFNIGQPTERAGGGGTYGFGKTISFVVSQARALVVHTRTEHGGGHQSRLIAAAFTDHFTDGDQRFTGRHWWGRRTEGRVEPLVDGAADDLAAALGLPGFGPDETGTTLAVVAPDLRGRTPAQAMRFLADAVTWNFWPKLLPGPGGAPAALEVEVLLEDEPVPVEPARGLVPLPAFAEALQAVRVAEAGGPVPPAPGVELHDVRTPRSGLHVGWLALARLPVAPRPWRDDGADEHAERAPAAAIDGVAHHVVLLRQPELVVTYLEGPELPTVASEWAGVFKPAPELDRAFAQAEPPTHDAWEPMLVPDVADRQWVNVALREVGLAAEAFTSPSGEPVGGQVSAVLVADALRSLLGEVPGGGADPYLDARLPPPEPPFVTYGDVSLQDDGDHHLVDVGVTLHRGEHPVDLVVAVDARVAVADGSRVERHPPDGAPGPVVVGLVDDDGTVRAGPSVVVAADDPPRWWARARVPAGVAVQVDVVATPAGEEPTGPAGGPAADRGETT